MPVPTWEECLEAGMTAREADRARGTASRAAYSWARYRGKAFAAAKMGRPEALRNDPHTAIDFSRPFAVVIGQTTTRLTCEAVPGATVAEAITAAQRKADELTTSTGRTHLVLPPAVSRHVVPAPVKVTQEAVSFE